MWCNLTQKQVNDARGTEETTLPEGLTAGALVGGDAECA
jgi:hypothetical protein